MCARVRVCVRAFVRVRVCACSSEDYSSHTSTADSAMALAAFEMSGSHSRAVLSVSLVPPHWVCVGTSGCGSVLLSYG